MVSLPRADSPQDATQSILEIQLFFYFIHWQFPLLSPQLLIIFAGVSVALWMKLTRCHLEKVLLNNTDIWPHSPRLFPLQVQKPADTSSIISVGKENMRGPDRAWAKPLKSFFDLSPF